MEAHIHDIFDGEMEVDCSSCQTKQRHDSCLCEECLMQSVTYFDSYEDAIERRPKRKSVTSEDELIGEVVKENKEQRLAYLWESPQQTWCPSFAGSAIPGASVNIYHDICTRYQKGEMFSMIPYVVDLSKKLIPGLWEKEKLKEVLNKFILTKETLERVMSAMNEDFDNGLSCNPELSHKSPVKMLVTYVRSTPNGTEEGDFYALDLGGTNFRVLLVKIHDKKIEMSGKKFAMDDSLMKGTGSKLFGYIAECLAKFSNEHKVSSLCSVGFTFSFPIDQKSLTSGNLIKWTKGYSADGVEGKDIVQLLNDELDKRDDIKVHKVALVNDTTGTMVSCAFDDPDVEIGLILGTGTNACYMEKTDNIPKWDGDQNAPKQVIINTEWGAFGEKGELNFVKTEYDIKVDQDSLYPGEQVYEKMISGMYLGEVARQVLIDLIKEKVIFNGVITEQLQKPGSFETRFLSDIANDEAKKILEVLEHLGYSPTLNELQIVKDACDMISMRSARLAAAGLATIIKRIAKKKLTVAVDGSLFKMHPKFKGYMEETLLELVPECKVKLMLSEDGSGRGAALVAAVASRLDAEQK